MNLYTKPLGTSEHIHEVRRRPDGLLVAVLYVSIDDVVWGCANDRGVSPTVNAALREINLVTGEHP